MARIPEAQVQDILQRNSIVAVVGEYVSLRPAGPGRFKGLCPFHSEKTPSFNVDENRGFFKCFGCGEGGDLITFLMKAETMSFHETVEKLALKAGVTLELSESERRTLTERERLLDLVERAATFYQQRLEGTPGHAYVQKRGLDADCIQRFRIGYAAADATQLLRHLTAAGYTTEEAMRAGVVRQVTSRDGSESRIIDYFRNRVVFPIIDAHGRVIAFGGRVLDDSQPKYLNSPETPLFSKSKTLYGLYQGRTAIGKSDLSVVVEGYMDVVSLHQAGVAEAVASLGTALTQEQARLLRRYCGRCILAYDADQAGRAAAERGIPIFEEAGLAVRVLSLPDGEDPDTVVRALGADGFRRRLEESPAVVDYLAEGLMRRLDLKTPEGKSTFVTRMAPVLRNLHDEVRMSEYVRRYAERIRISEEVFRRAVRAPAATVVAQQKGPQNPNAPVLRPQVGAVGEEEALLSFLLARPEGLARLEGRVTAEDFRNPNNRAIFDAICETPAPAGGYTAAHFANRLDNPGASAGHSDAAAGMLSRVTELLLDSRRPPLSTEYLEQLIERIETRRKERKFQELQAWVRAQTDSGTLDPTDSMYAEWQRLKRELKGKRPT